MSPKPKLFQRRIVLKAYNGQTIPTAGTCRAKMEHHGRSTMVQFVVTPGEFQPILGVDTCEKLDLVRQIHVINTDVIEEKTTKASTCRVVDEFPDVFKGLGCLPIQYKIQLKDNSVPVIHPVRKVPINLKERLRKELNRPTEMEVIKPMNEPTEWVNSLVIVEKKSGDLRLCIDLKDLNKNIRREHYHINTRTDITRDLAGSKVFTKLDASQAFHQIPLDPESVKLCTLNTPFGRYAFLRMPYGITSASEVYHRTMEQLFEGIEGLNLKLYIDDMIIYGKDEAEHDERLRCVLQRAREVGLRLNKKKCTFSVNKILYLGDVLTEHGIEPDETKVNAINNMPAPQSKKDLQRCLGMINYVGKFVPNLSVKTTAMRSLLENKKIINNEWNWSNEHKKEFQEIKRILTSKPVLQFYDAKKKIRLSTVSSKDGLGVVLLQNHHNNWLPVAYASRGLTAAEKHYAQIEKETLGLLFGCERFHEYIYGAKITLETDHKPLIAIFNKNLNDTPPRIQRLLLRIRDGRYNQYIGILRFCEKTIRTAIRFCNTGYIINFRKPSFISIDSSRKGSCHVFVDYL